MKPACGIKTIKGVVRWGVLLLIGFVVVQLLSTLSNFDDTCWNGESGCFKPKLLFGGPLLGAWLFLYIVRARIRRALAACFPVACGHRRCIFTGKSSKPLQEILLSADKEIPTEEHLQEFKEKALLYLNDIKTPLEETLKMTATTTTFQYIFSGSAVERFGIPLMMFDKKTNNSVFNVSAFYTDLDVMFCSVQDKASFSGQGNIIVEPLVAESEGFTGYAQLISLTPGFESECVSSKIIRDKAKVAVRNASVFHLPGIQCCCGTTELTSCMKVDSKGPAIRISILSGFEADITLCIQCSEWPPMSDWPSRPRFWPSVDEAHKIMSLGCHLVAKPAPSDQDKTSWRFSFSLAEVELSKLVPDTARKCFLALKTILKEHLKPVVPKITTYHIKTIFLNTLEKVPVGFWVEGNIEECFLTLLAELRDALVFMNCPHHWFSFINLFDIKASELQRLAKKVQSILNDPAPFIFDDGCCCLSPCCVRVPHYNFTRRSREQFLDDYDEVTLSADGHMMVGPDNHRHQLPMSSSPRSEASLVPTSYCSSGSQSQGITAGAVQLAVPLLPIHTAEQDRDQDPVPARVEPRTIYSETLFH